MTSIKDFGAFVEILPGKDGLCHISELADGYVNSVGDVCKVGDEMQVKVIAIDDQDRVKLSRKAALKELGIVNDKAPASGGERPRAMPVVKAVAARAVEMAVAATTAAEAAMAMAVAASETGCNERDLKSDI